MLFTQLRISYELHNARLKARAPPPFFWTSILNVHEWAKKLKPIVVSTTTVQAHILL